MMPDWHELSHRYHLSERQIDRLQSLFTVLKSVEDRNLTAVTTDEGIFNVHFLDSLSLLEFPELIEALKIVDIGTGAGFPGLPLAIAMPDAVFSLVESNKKKCEFISGSIRSIGIDNVQVEHVRAEDFGISENRGGFNVALARAVSSLPVVLEYTVPLLRAGGYALLQRGARTKDDKKTAVAASALIGSELLKIVPVFPYPGAKHLHVWVFKKIVETPLMYPRRSGMPVKKPLGA
jgi:16S rRNA (guanine527-N7)-methyltransferase